MVSVKVEVGELSTSPSYLTLLVAMATPSVDQRAKGILTARVREPFIRDFGPVYLARICSMTSRACFSASRAVSRCLAASFRRSVSA